MRDKIKSLRYKYKKGFQKLHPAIKLLLVGLCSMLLVFGLIVLLPLPEIGIPLVLISLSVLSFQYKWAEQLLNYFEDTFSNKTIKTLLLVIGVIVISVLVVLWLQ